MAHKWYLNKSCLKRSMWQVIQKKTQNNKKQGQSQKQLLRCLVLFGDFIPRFWWDNEIPLCSPSWRRSFVPCLRSTEGLAGAIRNDLLRTKSACLTVSCWDTRKTHALGSPDIQVGGKCNRRRWATRFLCQEGTSLADLCFGHSPSRPVSLLDSG